MKIHIVGKELVFPDPRNLRFEPEPGLVAVGGDLSVERLLLAYSSGIFPWTADPITWWSPNPRAILDFETFHIQRSLDRVLNRSVLLNDNEPLPPTENFSVTKNRAFREVIERCATTRRSGNWIESDFIEAYTELHQAGHAHSFEVWQDRLLVGGIYGVAIGGFFAGESMFHRVSNASKVALCFLQRHLRERGFVLFDIQMVTPTTSQFGAIEIPRDEYLRRLECALRLPVSF